MMIRSDLFRHAVSVCATAAMLAGCTVRDNPSVLPGAMPQTTSVYKVLYRFEGGSNGDFPQGNLVSVDGTLYGTAGGGSAGIGIVYSVTAGGVMTVLHNFEGGADGQKPQAGLIDVNGTLYGTTYAGGRSSHGTVYSISTAGAEKVLTLLPAMPMGRTRRPASSSWMARSTARPSPAAAGSATPEDVGSAAERSSASPRAALKKWCTILPARATASIPRPD